MIDLTRPFPLLARIPNRSSPSRVRFAASRPGLLVGRSERHAVYEGKGGLGFRAVSGPKGSFRPYQRLEPQRWGGVTRRAVAQRRSRASGLTRPLAEAISGVLFSGFILSRDGFDFGFLIRRFIHSSRRSYYLFFNYLFLLLVWVSTLVQRFWVKVSTLVQIRPLGVSALVLENSPKSRLPVETSQHRLSYEAQERFSAVSRPFPPNACPKKAHQGRSLGRERGIREPSLLADVALTEELRGSKDAGSARPEPLSSSSPARPA